MIGRLPPGPPGLRAGGAPQGQAEFGVGPPPPAFAGALPAPGNSIPNGGDAPPPRQPLSPTFVADRVFAAPQAFVLAVHPSSGRQSFAGEALPEGGRAAPSLEGIRGDAARAGEVAPERPEAREDTTPPKPQLFDLVGDGMLLDLPALEAGVKEFLQGLDGATTCVAAPEGGWGLSPWLIAASVAGVACEIARRQLKHAGRGPDDGLDPGPGSWLRRQGLSIAETAARTGLHGDSVRRILRTLARRLAFEQEEASPLGPVEGAP